MYCYIFIYYFRRVVLENRQEGLNVCVRVCSEFAQKQIKFRRDTIACIFIQCDFLTLLISPVNSNFYLIINSIADLFTPPSRGKAQHYCG